jgi:hypothetical protein
MRATTAILRGDIYDDISDPLRASTAVLALASKIQLMTRIPNLPYLVATSKVSIQLGCRSLQRGRIQSADGPDGHAELFGFARTETTKRLS